MDGIKKKEGGRLVFTAGEAHATVATLCPDPYLVI
jgi:hypothetical protein